MTYLVERLAELRRHLDHLEDLGPRVTGRTDLERDLSLHNDVLFSLLTVSQLVIDIAGELSAREGHRFEDYSGAVRNLVRMQGFDAALVEELSRIPGFRNVLIHEYVELDYEVVVRALRRLDPVREFAEAVRLRMRTEQG